MWTELSNFLCPELYTLLGSYMMWTRSLRCYWRKLRSKFSFLNFKRAVMLCAESSENFSKLYELIAGIAWSLRKKMTFSTLHISCYILWCFVACAKYQFSLHCLPPPKEATKIAISTAKQFLKDIKEVSNSLLLSSLITIYFCVGMHFKIKILEYHFYTKI
jgi:hypothetical protein